MVSKSARRLARSEGKVTASIANVRRLHIELADFMGKSNLVKENGTAQFGMQHEVSHKLPRSIRESSNAWTVAPRFANC
jgi:hypothetical protein